MSSSKSCIFKITSNVINLDEGGKPDGAPEKDELCVTGSVKNDKNIVTLSYKEKREGASVFSEVVISDNAVKVKRRGDIVSDMLFSEGKKHETLYQVPPFSFDMEIYTVRIENSIDTENGALTLVYDMTVGGAKKRCRMKILRKD